MICSGTNRDVVDRVRHQLEDRLGLHLLPLTRHVIKVVIRIGAFYFFEALHLTFRVERLEGLRALAPG